MASSLGGEVVISLSKAEGEPLGSCSCAGRGPCSAGYNLEGLGTVHNMDKLSVRIHCLWLGTELASEALGLPARMVFIGCCIRSVAVD